MTEQIIVVIKLDPSVWFTLTILAFFVLPILAEISIYFFEKMNEIIAKTIINKKKK